MVHIKTVECVCKAEALILEQTCDSMRYATLQLRMGIEFLFYELIPLYAEELPSNIITKWQPRQIIDALLECDPGVDQDSRITLVRSGETTADLAREIKAVNKRMLRDHYHRLGGYLHAPVDLVEPEAKKWREVLEQAVRCLKSYTPDQALANVACFIEFVCSCGRRIKRNRRAIEVKPLINCSDPSCGAIWDVTLEETGFRAEPREISYDCPHCYEVNHVAVHLIKDDLKITCDACNREVQVQYGYFLIPSDLDGNGVVPWFRSGPNC